MDLKKLVLSLAISLSALAVGSLFTSVGSWYSSLVKPSFNPPGWLFGPVWTLLYVLIGISLYLVWVSRSKGKKPAYYAFSVQLFLNALWSFLFFGLHSPLLAFIGIILLWISIVVMIVMFYRIRKTSAYLLVPYLLWVSFASVLNLSIVMLN